MSNIQKRIDHLPVKPEDLSRWILIGKVKLKAQIAAIKAISKLEEGMAAHAGALSDTQDLAEELLYAEARMGDMLAAIPQKYNKELGSSGGTQPSLPDGVNKKQSHYAQTLSRNMDKIADVVANAREGGEVPVRQHVLKAINVHVSRNSGEREWFTPQPYIDAARAVMGSIDCDPATTEEANGWINAEVFYTVDDSGLDIDSPWQGNVWLNPPYDHPIVDEFCQALIDKLASKETKQACIIVNNITETAAGQRLLSTCSAVCFPQGRVKFYNPTKAPKNSPLQGQMVVYFGTNQNKFMDTFAEFGACLRA